MTSNIWMPPFLFGVIREAQRALLCAATTPPSGETRRMKSHAKKERETLGDRLINIEIAPTRFFRAELSEPKPPLTQ